MNAIIKILENDGYTIPDKLKEYYSYISLWQRWWEGYVQEVHDYSQILRNGRIKTFKRYRMKMAKKVSEDWANMLLTHKTLINVNDKATQMWLAGDEVEQTKGILGDNDFWNNANLAIETAYASGTAAFILRVNDSKVVKNKLIGGKIEISYITNPQMIYPISWKNGKIIDCAFGSVQYIKGIKHIYLEKHLKTKSGYKVINEFYKYENEKPEKVALPEGMLEEFDVGCKLFHIVKPIIANNVYMDSPLGISIYADALDELETCDIYYDNFAYDGKSGRKRIFMNQDIISTDKNGDINLSDTLETRLFYSMGSKLPGDNQMYQEYNPLLRVEENRKGIQTSLDMISFKVGFGQHRYSFDAQNMTTATEVKVSNKDLTESVGKQRTMIETVVTSLVSSIVWLGKNVVGEKINDDVKVSITFDNSLFTDEESERLRFIQEIREGIRQKWEYRVKYFGEDEETAKKMVQQEDDQIEFTGAE